MEICLCYIALGNLEETKKYHDMIALQLPKWPGLSLLSQGWVIGDLLGREDLKQHRFWNKRVKSYVKA